MEVDIVALNLKFAHTLELKYIRQIVKMKKWLDTVIKMNLDANYAPLFLMVTIVQTSSQCRGAKLGTTENSRIK